MLLGAGAWILGDLTAGIAEGPGAADALATAPAMVHLRTDMLQGSAVHRRISECPPVSERIPVRRHAPSHFGSHGSGTVVWPVPHWGHVQVCSQPWRVWPGQEGLITTESETA